MTEPMHALLRHSVDVWNYDPVAFGFQQAGYISCGDESQIADYERIHKSQNNVDYPSDVYLGKDARDFLSSIWPDMQRFEGIRPNFRERRNGGIGAFTPDNVPIVDWMMPNVFMIAGPNHGFKMTGLGKLVARQLAGGTAVEELKPFALGRFERGQAFGSGTTHCPWV